MSGRETILFYFILLLLFFLFCQETQKSRLVGVYFSTPTAWFGLTAPLLALDRFVYLATFQGKGEGGRVREAVLFVMTAEGIWLWQNFFIFHVCLCFLCFSSFFTIHLCTGAHCNSHNEVTGLLQYGADNSWTIWCIISLRLIQTRI